jgi:hypothetical protein
MTVSLQSERVIAYVSEQTGQLLDWSATDRRIERIFFDNPERFRDSFTIVTDGCTKNKCLNASLLNISFRPGGRYAQGSLKVILIDRVGKKHVLKVDAIKVREVADSVMTFSPVAILSHPNNRSPSRRATPPTVFDPNNQLRYPTYPINRSVIYSNSPISR